MAEKKPETKIETTEPSEVEVKDKKPAKKKSKKLDLDNITMKQVEEMKSDYAKMRIDWMKGSIKDTTELRKMRKNIARALTKIRFNEIIDGQA